MSAVDGPDDRKVPGACLCGAIRFEVTLPTKWCAHCHCSMCRRAHGAGFVTWTGVPSVQLVLVAGGDQLVSYRSSQQGVRRFCALCGSSLFFESTRWPGEVHVAVANLLAPLDREPQAHVFFDDRVSWIACDDDLPRRGGPSGTEPLG